MRQREYELDIDLLVTGNPKQWEIFVRQISPVVFSVIKKTLMSAGRNVYEAHDLLQDFFVRLCSDDFRILKRYDPRRSRLSTWLAVIARNMTIDHLRRSRKQHLSLDLLQEQKADEQPDEGEHIHISFKMLPPRQMLIMKLLYERDMDVKEVAAFLGIAEQTVRSTRHKAVKRLRREFKTDKP